MHVHVHHADGEAKFWLEPEIELAQNYGLSQRRITAVPRLIRRTRMRSAQHGMLTSEAEVTNISAHGFWLLIGNRELFVPFNEFPWFRDAAVGHILNVIVQGPERL